MRSERGRLMKPVLVSMLVITGLAIAGCGGDEGDEGSFWCCTLDQLCSQSPTVELAPCLTDPAILTAANEGKESACKRMVESNELRVHKYNCDSPGHSQDCWFEESDAKALCQ